MATDTYWQLDKEYYAIAPNHDLLIRVIEHEDIKRTEGSGANERTVTESVPKKVHEFKVVREIVSKASAYFKKLLAANFKEGQQSTIDLHEDHPESMAVWFKIMHGCALDDDAAAYAVTTINVVWEVLAAAHKYGLDPDTAGAKSWFAKWYSANVNKVEERQVGVFAFHQMVLFPCHTFDHAQGFAAASEYLVYHATGHITEKRPAGFKHHHLRLESAVIQQVNSAKGRLKTILHRELYGPIDKLLKRTTCNCKANMLYAYEKALANTDAWPLETAYFNQSMQNILRKLDDFTPPPRDMGCGQCRADFGGVVDTAIEKTETYFDGLCLDCMSFSKPKFGGDTDKDYWRHAEQNVKWNAECRISHGEPSWYFSFMGRKEAMIRWRQEKKRQRQERAGYGDDYY